MQQLFDDSAFVAPPPPNPFGAAPASDWRGALSHPQFEFSRARSVFGNREGWGPLLLAPDTNLLIHLVEAFDTIESHFGIAGPTPKGDRDDPVQALRELFAHWFHRDIRWAIFESYLTDSKKPLSAKRVADRVRVRKALANDLSDRGGVERAPANWWDLTDDERENVERWIADDRASCHAAARFAPKAESLMPGYDGQRVAEALTTGCHVFLTEDRGILRHAHTLFGWGLALFRPGELLDALTQAGELDPVCTRYELAPDLLPLARFFAIQDR